MTCLAHDFFPAPKNPRFVIFASYGNDSIALIQWAYEEGLKDVVVVFSDTGWAARFWEDRVRNLEWWVHRIGFWTDRTQGIGFRELAFEKKALPTQRYQWCSYRLKIEPAERWLNEIDPYCRTICLVGVRREEGPDRANFPQFMLKSHSHGDRSMVAPLATWTTEDRDTLLRRAGVEPLPHRSMECSPCINSNRRDLQSLSEEDIARAEDLERELNDTFGKTRNGGTRHFFRPSRHMGAQSVREVVKWANAGRGKYKPGETSFEYMFDLVDEGDEGSSGCEAGWCGI